MPFGCRPHICPAKDVAPVLIAMMVATLLRNGITRGKFEFVVDDERDRPAAGGFLNLDRGAYASVRLRPRSEEREKILSDGVIDPRAGLARWLSS
jgi:hypothetical protein